MLKIQKEQDCASKTFKLPIELAEKLDKVACENNLSQTQLAIQCLNCALHKIYTAGEEKNDSN